MEIEIGTVVVLKSGGPDMTVTRISLPQGDPRRNLYISAHQRPVGERGNNEDCPICGMMPRIDSSEAAVVATMHLAQQQWRTRHDAHIDLTVGAEITCVWAVDGEMRTETFPLDAVTDPRAEDAPDGGYRCRPWGRRHRRIVRREDV